MEHCVNFLWRYLFFCRKIIIFCSIWKKNYWEFYNLARSWVKSTTWALSSPKRRNPICWAPWQKISGNVIEIWSLHGNDILDVLFDNFFLPYSSFVTGIEFRDSSLVIGPKTEAKVLKNQVYNINVGLSGLVNKDAKDSEGKAYALFIGDTVIVNEVSHDYNWCDLWREYKDTP